MLSTLRHRKISERHVTTFRLLAQSHAVRCSGKSALAPDIAVAPLVLHPTADGPCPLGLCPEDYRATGNNNPDKRLAFSWQKPGIF
jgi:hypothetical protein